MIDVGLRADLSEALERGELFAYYQPQQELATSRIVSAEALCRWQHPVLGPLSPALFIPLAEELGIIRDIGLFMFAASCLAVWGWQRAGMDVEVSVNVSATQLETAEFADEAVRSVGRLGLRPGAITVEITETVPIHDLPYAVTRLDLLRSNGMGVSIDDYGVGHTSVRQLDDLPVTELKLDQSLIQSESETVQDELVALVARAHERRIRVVAEGVETFADLDRARRLRCDRVQGYLIGQPMAKDDLDSLLRHSPIR